MGIVHELEYTAALQGNDRPVVSTVFFGGGTPSLMSGRAVRSHHRNDPAVVAHGQRR
ncbi:MAG: hypothetical protein WDM89_08810 [Rhizomicrobium sp.]